MTEAPPNPFFEWKYTMPICGKQATFAVPAPGGEMSAEAAAEVIEWMDLVLKRFRRLAAGSPSLDKAS